MILYLVMYCNGAEYDDWWETVVGVYSTQELAKKAGRNSIKIHGEHYGRAYYDVKEIVVDERYE